MNRKRFVKLLMAEGVSRNRAQRIAWDVNRRGRPYSEAFSTTIAMVRIGTACASVGVAFQKGIESINRVAEAIASLHAACFQEVRARAGSTSPIEPVDGLRTDVVIVDEWNSWRRNMTDHKISSII